MEENVYTVVGYSHGKSKETGKPFTKVALTCQPPFDNYTGYDVKSVFINSDIDIQLGDNVTLVFGCRYDGKAYVKGLSKVV